MIQRAFQYCMPVTLSSLVFQHSCDWNLIHSYEWCEGGKLIPEARCHDKRTQAYNESLIPAYV